MPEVKNCPECGDLFLQHLRTICNACYKAKEDSYEVVYNYMKRRENRQATLFEVHEKTGVAEERIIHYIREGRIQVVGLPNFSYPCEICERPVQDGRVCSSCRKEFKEELQNQELRMKQKLADLGRSYYTDTY